MRHTFLTALLLSTLALAGTHAKSDVGNPEVRVLSVNPTPEPDNVELEIIFPQPGDVKNGNPVNVEVKIFGFPLAVNSDYPRSKEIWNDPKGQAVHVFIDDEPYFPVTVQFISGLNDSEVYYHQTLDFDIPENLRSGPHVMRIFPVRSYNESLKGDRCFGATIFYVNKTGAVKDFNPQAPYLTYNEPQEEYDFDPQVPILLDFYVTNCRLTPDGYKVKLFVDGKQEGILTRWVPYYIYGLKPGKHKVRLVLIDPENKKVPGRFNDVERTFYIK